MVDREKLAEALSATVHFAYHQERADEIIKILGDDDSVGELRDALSWSLDLIDRYDEFLIDLGESREQVYSDTHVAGKVKARKALKCGPTIGKGVVVEDIGPVEGGDRDA